MSGSLNVSSNSEAVDFSPIDDMGMDEGVILPVDEKVASIYKGAKPEKRSAKRRARIRKASVVTTRSPEQKKATAAYASEVLEMTHALKKCGSLYKERGLIRGFLTNAHEDDPRLSKMQRQFNSLRERASSFPGGTDLFDKMVNVGIKRNHSKKGGLESIRKQAVRLIGAENVIDTGIFNEHGMICIKDAVMPDPRPENVITETELEQMHSLREALFNPRTQAVKIEGLIGFVSKTKKNFEKMLCFPEGRLLVRKLIEEKKNVVIKPGRSDYFKASKNKVALTHRKWSYIGHSDGVNVGARSPSWTVLAHELIHAIHEMEGSLDATRSKDILNKKHWTNGEELATIGDPTKKIQALTENGFRRHTLHPLRIYHTGPVSSSYDFDAHTLDENIDILIEANLTHKLIDILNTETLSQEQIKNIIITCNMIWSPALAAALIKNPAAKEVIRERYVGLFLDAAAEADDPESIELIFREFPEVVPKTADEKRRMMISGLEGGSKVIDFYVSLGYHSEVKKEDFIRQLTLSCLFGETDKLKKPHRT